MLNYVGVIGDIHGEDARLESALEWMRKQKVAAILAVGDIADGPGDLQRCVDLLREYDVQAVRGNHDDWFLRDFARDLENAHDDNALDAEGRSWLDALPMMRQWDTPSGELLLCHGVGGNFMRDLRPDDDKYTLQWNQELNELVHENRFRYMINGHTHQRMVRRFGNLVNLNAGKIADSDDKGEGGVWLVDFKRQIAWLHLFDGMRLRSRGQKFSLKV